MIPQRRNRVWRSKLQGWLVAPVFICLPALIEQRTTAFVPEGATEDKGADYGSVTLAALLFLTCYFHPVPPFSLSHPSSPRLHRCWPQSSRPRRAGASRLKFRGGVISPDWPDASSN
ncbi:hypothetical protein VUR80DRAFT_7915 [Thermomyces stellatus]